VTVPAVPHSGTYATDPVSCPFASRSLPFALETLPAADVRRRVL